MIKIQPLDTPEPPTKMDFFEYLYEQYAHYLNFDNPSMDYIYDYLDPYFGGLVAWYQRKEMRSFGVVEEYFNDNWRKGQAIHKIVITQRFYQVSPNSTQA